MTGRAFISLLSLVLVWGTLLGKTASAGDAQQVMFQVAVPESLTLTSLRAEIDHSGTITAIPLSDDGRIKWDIPDDNVYLGTTSGDYARTISVKLFAEQGATTHVVFAGVLRTEDPDLATLGWRLIATPDGPTSVRVPVPYPGTGGETYESLQLVSAFGWGVLVMGYVAFLVLRSSRRPRRPGSAASP
jgi:hypothetical protein